MKRVLLMFTLMLFLVGLTIPSISVAENSARSGSSNETALTERTTSGQEDQPVISSKKTIGLLGHIIDGCFFQRLPIIGMIVISIGSNDTDGKHLPPCEGPPPGDPRYRIMDEHGWDETF